MVDGNWDWMKEASSARIWEVGPVLPLSAGFLTDFPQPRRSIAVTRMPRLATMVNASVLGKRLSMEGLIWVQNRLIVNVHFGAEQDSQVSHMI